MVGIIIGLSVATLLSMLLAFKAAMIAVDARDAAFEGMEKLSKAKKPARKAK